MEPLTIVLLDRGTPFRTVRLPGYSAPIDRHREAQDDCLQGDHFLDQEDQQGAHGSWFRQLDIDLSGVKTAGRLLASLRQSIHRHLGLGSDFRAVSYTHLDKNWKVSSSDNHERKYWKQYMEAYEECLNARCV